MGNTKELKHISLCAGYGGIDLGLSRALGAIRTVCFVEIEAFCIENLVSKIEGGWLDPAPVFTDLKKFPWESFSGRVDILTGGFPCQPFSGAGRRAGDEDPRHLWPYITDGIKRLGRPALVLFENVEGIISSKLKSDDWSDPKGTSVLLHVLRELERLGYDAEAGVFSAREVGAPHQRKRTFIMGVRSDLGQAGRDIVSSMLRDTQSGTAYPAPRGAEQYPFEPPRVTQLGDTKHNGSSTSKKRRSVDKASDDNSKGAHRTCKSAGAGESRREADLSRSEKLGDTDCGDKRSHGRESRILSQTVCDRETDRHQRTSLAVTVGDTDEQGLQGEVPAMDSRRPHALDTVTAPRSSTHGDIQGEAESSMGRDVDGASSGMGYAELCESLDNRTDELRLLGNGVVPGTAERAFRELWRDLNS